MDQIQQRESAVVRHVVAAQLDARRFSGELRMRRDHFAIEQEGDVSVEFFL